MAKSGQSLVCTYLGRVDYESVLGLQLRIRAEIKAGRAPDTLLLVEHPAVITLGRSAVPANVLASQEYLEARGICRVQVGRGGDVTYHGPGQLVAYPLRRVGRAILNHLHGISNAIVALLAEYDVVARWSRDNPGIWTAAGKIAAVGVDARGGVACHGLALNVAPDLAHFGLIVPCGLHQPVTSMRAIGVEPVPILETLAWRLAALLALQYQADVVPVTPESVWGQYASDKDEKRDKDVAGVLL